MDAHREDGQALLLALGGSIALVAVALALVAIAGAVTGKGRAQRAADLAAISAARSMRDDLPRLLTPTVLADGSPNPAHLEKSEYLARARAAARRVAGANEVAAGRLAVSFPDGASFAPLRVKAVLTARLDLGQAGAGATKPRVEASAVAEAAAPAGGNRSMPAMASGGGYAGPLVYRQGEGMRPDVAAAFDRMSAAAAGAGLDLLVNSTFRSDAEQAALFAAHPDPRWVAPPGHSLHRCATELDLGPEAAYAWLAANAGRFGFVQRYSWETWHFGYTAGPPPCSAAGNAVGAQAEGGGGDGALAGDAGLPAFVPPRFRNSLLRAATQWNVSAALLAAQLMAESNFNPYAGSPAGAQGIAQFMPSTAAAYGLKNPFDPGESMDAQAHLMSDLIHQLGSPQLALAAYNAGPAPVEACGCVPGYPETQAYVTRILALLGGAGALALPTFEVRLVA
jgi:Transglycosylase SLT domain/D-alanyl-D-alanine carboxypeptidase